jgi:hypothetical protein
MNPVRKACLEEAARLWLDQPSLGLLETANEVRVGIRGQRGLSGPSSQSGPHSKELPGVDAIRKWLVDAIASGEMTGPIDDLRRNKATRSRRQGQ